jgi:hypothetical protein
MPTIALSWETWRAVIPVLREKAVPSMLEHADALEQLAQYLPDQLQGVRVTRPQRHA